MLLFQRSLVEGSLPLILQCALYADKIKASAGEERKKYNLLLDLLTPVAKSYPSEMSVFSVSTGLQILGGYWFCDEFPLEQYYRDTRIHPIHEGTTGIHGLDLLGRKVQLHHGLALELMSREIVETVEAVNDPDLASRADDLLASFAEFKTITSGLVEKC